MNKLKYILFLLIIFLVPNVFAQSINSDSYSQKDTFTNSNRYDYSTNQYLGDDTNFSIGTIGTRYNGKSYYFQFNFHKSLTANKIYELKVSSTTSDFTSYINKDYITPLCYSSFAYNFNTKECGDISIISVIRGSGNQSKDFTIRFSPLQAMTYWGFKLQSGFNNLTGVSNFLINGFDLVEVNADNTDEIINNNNQNTQDIIDNANQNTQDIIDSTKACTKFTAIFENSYINSNGFKGSTPNWFASDFLRLSNGELKVSNALSSSGGTYYCFYDDSKVKISCYSSPTTTGLINVPSNAVYFRYSSYQGLPVFEYCRNGNQAIDDSVNNLNDTLNNSNIDNGVGSDFFNNFSSQDFGLSQIITLPLTTIQSLANTSCVSLNIPIPFTNSTIPLPCMTQVYQTYIPTIFSIWQVVSFGIIAYFICIDIVHLVKGFKDPDSDKVEVLDL